MSKFTKINSAIIASFSNGAKTIEKTIAAIIIGQNKAIQSLVDAHLLACDTSKALYMKGNASSNDARKEVKALFDTLASKEFVSKSTAASYQSCFWIAFETGVPFFP